MPVLLFDVMDTLVYNPFNREIPEFFGLSQTGLLEQKHPTAWIRFESGRIDEAAYLQEYFADGRVFDHAAFLATVNHAYRWVEGSEAVLQDLCRRGFEIHALSNYPVWYRNIEDRLRISRYLEWTFVSCRTGRRKPDPAAFTDAAQHLGRNVADCLFIDDSPANCRSAEAVGMSAILFSSAAKLRVEMRKRGLLD
jgi:FMN phosphatase YigB (HAD superfamily)